MFRFTRDDGSGKAPSLALLSAVTALAFCGLHMVVPALPLLVAVFDDSAARVQLVLSLYLAGIAAGQLVYGPASDRFGRRPVLIAGLATFLVGTALCGAAWSLPALIAGRVLQALGACAGIVLSRAIIRDVYDREAAARGLALVMMAMTLAPAASPTFGAYLAEWVDWRAIFVLLGGLGALLCSRRRARLGETNRHPVRLDLAGMAGAYGALLRSPVFVAFAVCSACTSASWFTFIASAPHLLARRTASAAQHLRTIDPDADGDLHGRQRDRRPLRAADRQPAPSPGGPGARLCRARSALALWAGAAELTVWTLFLPIALAEIGDGMSQPSVMAAALSLQPRLAGTASGLHAGLGVVGAMKEIKKYTGPGDVLYVFGL